MHLLAQLPPLPNIIAPLLGNPTSNNTQVVDIAAQQTSISGISSIGRLIEIGASAILIVGGLAFLMYLLLGGFNWLTAGGDKSKVEAARESITQAIIGLAILASVFAVYSVVLRFLGITSIKIGSGGSNQTTNQTSGNSAGCTGGKTFNDGGSGGYCTGG